MADDAFGAGNELQMKSEPEAKEHVRPMEVYRGPQLKASEVERAMKDDILAARIHRASLDADGSASSLDVEVDEASEKRSDVASERSEAANAVKCQLCDMWLNGPEQWEDHRIGKKHRKHLRHAGRGASGDQPQTRPYRRRGTTQPCVE